jgi:hypothetical protein
VQHQLVSQYSLHCTRCIVLALCPHTSSLVSLTHLRWCPTAVCRCCIASPTPAPCGYRSMVSGGTRRHEPTTKQC